MKLLEQAKLAQVFQEMTENNNLIICGRSREDASGTFVMVGGGGNDVMAMACQICASIYVRYQDQLKEDVSFEDFLDDLRNGIEVAYEGLQDSSSYSDYGSMLGDKQ